MFLSCFNLKIDQCSIVLFHDVFVLIELRPNPSLIYALSVKPGLCGGQETFCLFPCDFVLPCMNNALNKMN